MKIVASFQNSFNQVYAMRPEQLQLGFLKVLNGSPMEAMANGYGIVSSPNPPYEVLFTPWLSYKEVLALKGVEEMVEIHYNSRPVRDGDEPAGAGICLPL